jgi:hypothetical protein
VAELPVTTLPIHLQVPVKDGVAEEPATFVAFKLLPEVVFPKFKSPDDKARA